MDGALVILNDCSPEIAVEYDDWYQNEHLPERLSIPGFLLGRRYEAVDATHQFLTVYNIASVSVLSSEAYLSRVADPSPLTQKMMSEAFKNMSRTVCEYHHINGAAYGGIIVAAVSNAPETIEWATNIIDSSVGTPIPIRQEAWLSVEPVVPERSKEELIRGPDKKISACLASEFLRESDGRDYARFLRDQMPHLNVGVFRLLSLLRSGDIV